MNNLTRSPADTAIDEFVEAFRNDLNQMVDAVSKFKNESSVSQRTVYVAAWRLIDMQSIEEHFAGKVFSELADKLID